MLLLQAFSRVKLHEVFRPVFFFFLFPMNPLLISVLLMGTN